MKEERNDGSSWDAFDYFSNLVHFSFFILSFVFSYLSFASSFCSFASPSTYFYKHIYLCSIMKILSLSLGLAAIALVSAQQGKHNSSNKGEWPTLDIVTIPKRALFC